MELDKELKDVAVGWAEKIFNEIYTAISDPTLGMSDEAKRIYAELKAWGFFDKIGLDTAKAHEIIIPIIAMPKYKVLVYNKDHPPKSKWEVVTGKAVKKQ
jgi:hypothetical protein